MAAVCRVSCSARLLVTRGGWPLAQSLSFSSLPCIRARGPSAQPHSLIGSPFLCADRVSQPVPRLERKELSAKLCIGLSGKAGVVSHRRRTLVSGEGRWELIVRPIAKMVVSMPLPLAGPRQVQAVAARKARRTSPTQHSAGGETRRMGSGCQVDSGNKVRAMGGAGKEYVTLCL